METLYKIQPTEIEQLMKEKLADRKIDDEFGWTGEWRMSAKNMLDLIIDLQNNPNSQTRIEKLEAEKAEMIGALENLKLYGKPICNDAGDGIIIDFETMAEIESLIQKNEPMKTAP